LQSKKGKAQTIEWDESLEEMRREKDVADANRGVLCLMPIVRHPWTDGDVCEDLKERFRSKAERLKSAPLPKKKDKGEHVVRLLASNYADSNEHLS
jgi:hypothetical protein